MTAAMKPEWKRWAEEAKAEFPVAQSALLPFLHRVQAAEGWLSDEARQAAADLLGLSRQYVESVVSFYALLRTEPTGRRVIHVCTSLSCALAGADELLARLEEKLGIAVGQTTPDGQYTLLEAECLAACSLAPACQVNLRYVGPVPPEEADRLLQEEVEVREDT
jgi:NADH-quinone oxidoreductase subunit E